MFSKQPPSSPPLSWSAKAARTKESPISSLLAMALHNPNLISFAAGLVDAPTLPVEQCAAITRCIDRGVLYVPGDYCFHPDESGRVPQHCLRLCFGQVSHDQIDTGIQRLGKIVVELLETTPIVLGDSLGCCSLNPEPRTLSHE